MSLLTDVQAAVTTFVAKVATLVTQTGYLVAVITGPASGASSLVNVGPRVLKTLARTLLEIQASQTLNPVGVYSSGTTYAELDAVSYNGFAYVSLQNSNLNHQPDISLAYWMQLVGLPTQPRTVPGAAGDSTDGTDGANDTAAIQAALGTGDIIYLPQGGYRITSALLVSNFEGAGIVGDGPGKTIIWVDSATEKGVKVDAFAERPVLRDFSVRRPTGTIALVGANNIEIIDSTDGALIQNITSLSGYYGFLLGAGNGFIGKCVAQNCQSDGVRLSDEGAIGPVQWTADGVKSLTNNGNGFSVVALQGPISTSDMINLQSFANSGFGFAAIGSSGKSIEGLRLTSCFFGTDGNYSVYLNTWNTFPHVFVKVETEQNGTASTGVGLATPASGFGGGFLITGTNNAPIALDSCVAETHSGPGVFADGATQLIVRNGLYRNNSGGKGIWSFGVSAMILGNRCSGQTTGIAIDDAADNCLIENNDVRNNVSFGIFNDATGTNNIIRNNPGHNPVGVSAITVGGSPFSYTAGSSDETIFLRGGTVSNVTVAGVTVFTASERTIELRANQTMVVTYSGGAPTLIKSAH